MKRLVPHLCRTCCAAMWADLRRRVLCVAPRDKNKSTQKRAGVNCWSYPGPCTMKGTRKIASASKTPQEGKFCGVGEWVIVGVLKSAV